MGLDNFPDHCHMDISRLPQKPSIQPHPKRWLHAWNLVRGCKGLRNHGKAVHLMQLRSSFQSEIQIKNTQDRMNSTLLLNGRGFNTDQFAYLTKIASIFTVSSFSSKESTSAQTYASRLARNTCNWSNVRNCLTLMLTNKNIYGRSPRAPTIILPGTRCYFFTMLIPTHSTATQTVTTLTIHQILLLRLMERIHSNWVPSFHDAGYWFPTPSAFDSTFNVHSCRLAPLPMHHHPGNTLFPTWRTWVYLAGWIHLNFWSKTILSCRWDFCLLQHLELTPQTQLW